MKYAVIEPAIHRGHFEIIVYDSSLPLELAKMVYERELFKGHKNVLLVSHDDYSLQLYKEAELG